MLVAADDQADDRLVEQVLERDLAQRQPERARSEHAGRVEHALRVFDGIDRARQECHESVEDGARIERDGIDDGLGLDHGKHGAVAADRPAVEPECTGNGGGSFRSQGETSFAFVGEGVHLFFDDIGAIAYPTFKEFC